MGFRLVPNSVTLNDLEWCNGSCFALFYRILQLSGPIMQKWLHIDPHCLGQKCSPKNLLFSNIWLMTIFSEVSEMISLKRAPPLKSDNVSVMTADLHFLCSSWALISYRHKIRDGIINIVTVIRVHCSWHCHCFIVQTNWSSEPITRLKFWSKM